MRRESTPKKEISPSDAEAGGHGAAYVCRAFSRRVQLPPRASEHFGCDVSAGEVDHHVAVAETEQEVGQDLTGVGFGFGQ